MAAVKSPRLGRLIKEPVIYLRVFAVEDSE
jgi:hypothetical protein